MPAINFQPRFAQLVESGAKRQTIRLRRKDGRDPKPGDTLYLYTGMRTKACKKLGEATCLLVMPFSLSKRHEASGNVNMTCGDPGARGGSRRFRLGETHGTMRNRHRRAFERIARADGFDSAAELVAWFEETHSLPFDGIIIRW